MDDLARISPAEVLVSERQSAQFGEIEGALAYDDFAFLADHARFTLCEHFGVKSLDGFGCSDMPAAIGAAGAIIHYLKQQLRRKVDHLASLRCDARDDYVLLDAATQVNLELVRIARRAKHEPARRARSNGDADGRAEVARPGSCSRCAISPSWSAASK